MIISNEIRRAVLDGKSDYIRGLLLNQQQIWLVRLVDREKQITAAGLSSLMDISLQNASAKLSRLYRAGYIQRDMVAADSGGIEYVYKPLTLEDKCKPQK